MSLVQNDVNTKWLNRSAQLPFVLRLKDFEIAMQDVYDFFYDVNLGLIERGLQRLDDMLQPAIMHVRDFIGHAHNKPGKTFQKLDRQPLPQ